MSLVTISKNNIESLNIINTKGITATDVKEIYKPDVFMNLALYDMATKENIVKMNDDGVESGYLFSDEGIGITENNELVWTTFRTTKLNNKRIRDFVAGAPTLVKDNKIHIDWGNKVSKQIQGKAYRSAIGFNLDTLFLFTSENKMTLEELSRYMQKIGCRWAINLDGGGSCHLQIGTKVYKKSIRKNASWFMVYDKEGDFEVYKYTNNSSKSLPVYETTSCKKKIGSLDPYETCDCLYEDDTFKVVLYNITGKTERKVGFIRG